MGGDEESAGGLFLPGPIGHVGESAGCEGMVSIHTNLGLIGVHQFHKLRRRCEMQVLAVPIVHAGVILPDFWKEALLLDFVNRIAALADGLVAILLLRLHHVAGIHQGRKDFIILVIQVAFLIQFFESHIASKALRRRQLLVGEILLPGVGNEILQRVRIKLLGQRRLGHLLGISFDKLIFVFAEQIKKHGHSSMKER